ncbi:S1C family serine protease [Bifidobacterium sp.]|uniref:S1C family serine protease n=1 Tax=Bifidobacterium sp. TaxID=41200 RepID=UPI0039E881DD
MAEDEHKTHPWEGDGDDQSWQPSHIDSHDTVEHENGDAETEAFTEPLTERIDGGADSQSSDAQSQETQRIDVSGENESPTTQLPSGTGHWLNSDPDGSSNFPESNPFVSQSHASDQHENAQDGTAQDASPYSGQYGNGEGAEANYQGYQANAADASGQETQPISPYSAGQSEDASRTQSLSSVADEAPDDDNPTEALSSSQAEGSQQTQPGYSSQEGYRPAPEYGAYAENYNQQPQSSQQGQPQYGASYQGEFNPYPYGAPEQTAESDNSGETNRQQPQNSPYGPQYPQSQEGAQTPGAQYPQGPQGPQGPQYPFGPQFNPNGPSGPNRQKGRPRGRSKTVNTIVVAVIAALVSAALMLGLGWAAISNGLITLPTAASISSLDSSTSGSGSATAKSGEAPDWQAVEKEVSSSVVSIETTVSGGVDMGSGAIIDTAGDIVTNNHVITGATKIQVTLSNGQIYSAKTVGTDTTTDLAVIKLENPPSNLKAVTFADSDSVAVGENIMAIGNPLGYDNTATTGIVSALNRPVSVMDDTSTTIVTNAIQIDAAINPGNSGGPTFNAAGQVVGINSSIASTASSSSTAGSIGIGFAIPSNLVKRISQEIIKDGSVKHVALGVSIQSATVESDGVTRGGAKIVSVTSGSPAAKAGLKTGDVIVGYDGNAVNSNYSVLGFVRASAYGAKATITVVRNGSTQNISVTLNQEESAVTGKSKSDSSGSSDGDSEDDGSLTDPYSLLEGN